VFLAALGVLGTGTRLFPHRQSGTDVLSLSATDAGHRIAANMRRCRIALSLESASHEYNLFAWRSSEGCSDLLVYTLELPGDRKKGSVGRNGAPGDCGSFVEVSRALSCFWGRFATDIPRAGC
jgi:hypothetical protein